MLRITPEEMLLNTAVVSQAPSTSQWLYNFKARVFNLSAISRCVLLHGAVTACWRREL